VQAGGALRIDRAGRVRFCQSVPRKLDSTLKTAKVKKPGAVSEDAAPYVATPAGRPSALADILNEHLARKLA